MVQKGDLIEIESEKVGAPPRQGSVLGVQGTMLRVRWSDGGETTFSPSAGSLRVVGKGQRPTRRGGGR